MEWNGKFDEFQFVSMYSSEQTTKVGTGHASIQEMPNQQKASIIIQNSVV